MWKPADDVGCELLPSVFAENIALPSGSGDNRRLCSPCFSWPWAWQPPLHHLRLQLASTRQVLF